MTTKKNSKGLNSPPYTWVLNRIYYYNVPE